MAVAQQQKGGAEGRHGGGGVPSDGSWLLSPVGMGHGSWAAAAAAAAGAPPGYALLSTAPSSPSARWALDMATAARRPGGELAAALRGAGLRVTGGGPLAGVLWWASPAAWWATRASWEVPPAPRRAQLIEQAVQLAELEALLRAYQDDPQSPPPAGGLPAARAAAAAIARSLAANQWRASLRVCAALLTRLWRCLYAGRVLVDAEGVERVRRLAGTRTLVYVPTHKSHLDYLILSYALFSLGMQSPITAAGVNLNIPIVGRVCQWFGAFYISRSTRGQSSFDAELYRKTLRGYVHALLLNKMPVEFFIEGGRARDGRIATPRLGLLAAVLDAQLDLPLPQPVAIVPVSIAYDVPLEEPAMVQQLLGHPKKKESLLGFAHAFWGVLKLLFASGSHGMAVLSFGEPLLPENYLEARAARHRQTQHACGGRRGREPAPGSRARRCRATPQRPKTKKKKRGARKAGGGGGGGGAEPQQAGEPGGSAQVAAPSGVGNGWDPDARMERLTLYPRGGEARRAATAALGADVVAALRGANVVPQAALLLAAVGAPMAVPQGATGGRLTPRRVLRGAAWLARELRSRGHRSVGLAPPGQSESESLQAVLRCAGLVPECVEVRWPAGSDAAPAAQPKLSLRPELRARCMVQSRLNYLLPAFAAEGLLVAALHAEARRAASRRGDAGHWAREAPEAAVPAERVAASAAWLRLLLAEEVDCHVGQGALCAPADFAPAAARLLEGGGLLEVPLAGGGKGLALAPSHDAKRAALLAGWLLRPLCATALFVLQEVAEALRGAEGGCMSQAELLQGVTAAVDVPGKMGPAAVPSVVVAQSCLVGLVRVGVLVPVAAAPAAQNGTAPGRPRPLPRVATDNWALVERAKSKAAEPQVLEVLLRKPESVLALAEEYSGSPAALQALALRMVSFQVPA
eukprot:jgi/Tetstr1/420434/TSEL_011548.t1